MQEEKKLKGGDE